MSHEQHTQAGTQDTVGSGRLYPAQGVDQGVKQRAQKWAPVAAWGPDRRQETGQEDMGSLPEGGHS